MSSTCRPIPSTTIADKSVYDVPGTHNVGLPTQYQLNDGPASQLIAGSMPVNRIRRWPNIETELGDCSDCHTGDPHLPKSQNPDYAINWPNFEIMLGYRLRGWDNIILTKTLQALNHECNREYLFFEDFLSTKVLNLGTSNVILDMFIRTGVQKCQPFPTHITPSSP